MSQVIIVSNRLPVSVKKEDGRLTFSPSIGGLATGLSSYITDRKNTWIGWPGISSDNLTESDRHKIVTELAKHNCSPVFLTQREVDEFYNGYSNGILWPVFHNLSVEDVDASTRNKWWKAYRSVNRKFAEAVVDHASKGSRIWVHDYQLLLVPDILRTQLSRFNSIGFFLHIPFPSAKTFMSLSECRKLLTGMLGADLLGFHTSHYVSDFIATCQQTETGIAEVGQVILAGRVVRVAEFPMGIDYQKYADATKSRVVKAAIRSYKKRYKGKKIIVAVDRLDPSKGLAERLQAYKEFLEVNPKFHGKVVFSMVAAPSRTEIAAYKELSEKLDALAKDINDTFGTPKWQPVDYINTTQPFEHVAALFAIADVAFIAPLRDGMNLAAKEFVASNRNKGALILSQTAGAAEELKDALIVNPHKPETSVSALQQALTMRKRELKSRLKNMQKHLSNNTVHEWAKNFVDSMQQPVPGTRHRTRSLIRPRFRDELLGQYEAAKKRLILLDYDGSLIPFQDDYKAAKPPKTVLALVESLTADKHNTVVLISGRKCDDLELWFGHLPIDLIAEHGAATKKARNKTWRKLDTEEIKWKQALIPVFEKYADLTPRARVENKSHSLVWHYRAAPPYYAQKHSVILKRALKPYLKSHGIQMFQGDKILEVKDPRISKGAAIRQWLKKDTDFILAIGDDFTDEDLFAALPPTSYTIKVGRGRTHARYRLPSYVEVRALLKKLANC